MKYVKMTIITRREKLVPLQKCLMEMGIEGMSVFEVEGNGVQNGQLEYWERDGRMNIRLIPKVKVELYLYSIPVSNVLEQVLPVIRTDLCGAGKIFIKQLEGDIITVRTGECNEVEEILDMEPAKKEMTQITIITRREKFDELRKELVALGVSGMTVTDVDGCGKQHGISKIMEGVTKRAYLVSKIKVDIVVCEVPVQTVIDKALEVLQTGNIGDGKIFTSRIDHVIRVRTGEMDEEAL